MTLVRRYLQVGSIALQALLFAALVTASIAAAISAFSSSVSSESRGSVAFMVLTMLPLYAMVVGTVAIAALGAPIYSLLLHFQKATWWSALAVGLLPGALLWNVEPVLGYFSLGFGAFVAAATHHEYRRRHGRGEPGVVV